MMLLLLFASACALAGAHLAAAPICLLIFVCAAVSRAALNCSIRERTPPAMLRNGIEAGRTRLASHRAVHERAFSLLHKHPMYERHRREDKTPGRARAPRMTSAAVLNTSRRDNNQRPPAHDAAI